MRIRQVDKTISLQSTIEAFFLLFFCVFALFGISAFVLLDRPFQELIYGSEIIDYLILVVCILISCVFIVCTIIKKLTARNEALKLSKGGDNIKCVDLSKNKVSFKFMDSKYDFDCPYEDIEKIDMNLITKIYRFNREWHIGLSEVAIAFHLINGKTCSVVNTPLHPAIWLYRFLGHIKYFQNFSYEFTGYGVEENLKERIDDYRVCGYMSILSTAQEVSLKRLSIYSFIIGMFLAFLFINFFIDPTGYINPYYAFIFVYIAFIFDLILFIDKMIDRAHHAEHKSEESLGKIPSELIACVQFLIFAAFLLFVHWLAKY